MTYELSLVPDKTYIILKVKGDITRKLAMQQNLEAHAMGEKLGVNRYLVDMTESRNVDTVYSNYEFAYSDMNSMPGIDRTARVAIVVSEGDHSHNFIETVARNSGLDVELFTDMEQAIDHLKK